MHQGQFWVYGRKMGWNDVDGKIFGSLMIINLDISEKATKVFGQLKQKLSMYYSNLVLSYLSFLVIDSKLIS